MKNTSSDHGSKVIDCSSTSSSGQTISERTLVEEVVRKEKQRTKRVIVPPPNKKSPTSSSASLLSPKKSFLIRKFKLKSNKKSNNPPPPPPASSIVSLPSSSGVEIGRQTPEGGEFFMSTTKSVSETNLTNQDTDSEEYRWKKNSTTDNDGVENLKITADDNGDKREKSSSADKDFGVVFSIAVPDQQQCTKSLENLKDMPAYGDLIAADPEVTMSHAVKSSEKKDHLYKILVIGDLGCGKTSIIKRYVHRFFTQHYRATIGVDFALKVLNWDENTLIRLQLWDIAGQERYGNMTRVYYKEAVGAFVVFDCTRSTTFESVAKWKSDLDTKVQLPDGSPIPCVLLANKCDQPKEGIVNNAHKMEEYCRENGFSAWFETSAKDNINIDEAARALVTKILDNDALLQADSRHRDDDKISLATNNGQRNHVGKSSCPC